MSYHAEVRAFSHGDGHWADWWRVGFLLEEGWLEKGKSMHYSEKETTSTIYIQYGVSLCYVCTREALVTVAACGSSPHAQCMAGF